MDALTLITLVLFAVMVAAWAILPNTSETVSNEDVVSGATAPATSAQ